MTGRVVKPELEIPSHADGFDARFVSYRLFFIAYGIAHDLRQLAPARQSRIFLYDSRPIFYLPRRLYGGSHNLFRAVSVFVKR